jgi:hypothetical protein
VFDTRTAASTCATPPTITAGAIGATGVLHVKITGVAGIPDTATAVVLNLTAVGATTPTYVSAYPDSPDQPSVSNLNVSNAKPVPNLAVVPVGPGGVIDFFNKAGSVNLLADLAGYFAPTGSQYTTTGPCRMFDTRSGTGICPGAIGFTAGAITGTHHLKFKVTGVGGVPANATAVVLNVTAVGATVPTFVSVYPDALTPPGVSNLNVNGPGAIPNLVIVPVGPGGFVDFYNAVGSVNVIADVSGYFAP